jgi:hypothetical protein
MGIAAGSLIRQRILRDPEPPNAWARHRTALLSVRILNSVAYEGLTGMLAPPTPITPQMYLAAGLPMYRSYGEGTETDGSVNFAGIKNVGEIDAEDGSVQLAFSVASSRKIGCTCCRTMFCDTM